MEEKSHATGDAAQIYSHIHQHHDGKYGFVIYRIAYNDDEQWSQFIDRLTAHATIDLKCETEDKVNGDAIRDAFAWDIRNNESEFKDASKLVISQHFKEWVASVRGHTYRTKYTECIYADQETIDSVMNGEEPGEGDMDNPEAFVKVLSSWYNDDVLGHDGERPRLSGRRRMQTL